MIKKLRFRIVGTRPLIMHNGRLADPMDEFARAIAKISSKRNKTDADYEKMAELEWKGSLYLYQGKPCIPGYVIEGVLIGKNGAARRDKMKKEGAAGIIVEDDFPLEYDGPKDPDKLWELPEFRFVSLVRVGTNRIVRTRPIFPTWAATVEVGYDPEVVDEDRVIHWMNKAGDIGIGDFRPKYGRFVTEFLGEVPEEETEAVAVA